MSDANAIVRSFYDKLSSGDAPGALGLMAPDVEWTTMWYYKVDGRGPEKGDRRGASDGSRQVGPGPCSFGLQQTNSYEDAVLYPA